MPSPGKTTLCCQLAAMESVLAASNLAAAGYMRLLRGHEMVFEIRRERRNTLKALDTPYPSSTGARLEDHYGRRNHDVDLGRL